MYKCYFGNIFRFLVNVCLCSISLNGYTQDKQILLSDDILLPLPTHHSPSRTSTPHLHQDESVRTSAVSLVLPFFDDFSYEGVLPDPAIWDVGDTADVPLISRRMAINPPSYGTATFDGANASGLVYATNLLSGPADRLVSQPIDLSAFRPFDNVILSFFLQAQGKGNAPEASDRFTVSFKNQEGEFQEVFTLSGDSNTQFIQHVIPLSDQAFFHSDFQMAFQNIGSLNGYLDQWHLDYVLLDVDRGDVSENTNYEDISPIHLIRSPLDPFTGIPLNVFQDKNDWFQPVNLLISNLSNSSQNGNVEASISDPVNNRNFTNGGVINSSFTIPADQVSIVATANTFTNQSFDTFGAYKVSLQSSGIGDAVANNNQVIEQFPIDSLLAYDDGEADAAYGINNARGFGVQVTLDEPRLLTAVWMSFVPGTFFNPNTNQSIDLADRAFRLAVWNAPDPDSIFYRQLDGTKVVYGSEIDHFERFVLTEPQLMEGTFWVGLQQLDGVPIGLGFDLTYENDALCFWDSIGTWTSTRLGGTFMIRPEFAQREIITSNLPDIDKETPYLTLYPSPIDNDHWYIQIENGLTGELLSISSQLFNMEGKLVSQILPSTREGNQIHYRLSSPLPSGIYVQYIEMEYVNRNPMMSYLKVYIP